MALLATVKVRVKNQRLIELTNDTTGATSIDDIRLQAAVDDVEADFKTWAGVIYDDNNAQHVSIAIEGVVLKLQFFTKNVSTDLNGFFSKWRDDLERLRIVTAQDRFSIASSSELTPADETTAGVERRPDFDPNSAFEDYIPNLKRAGNGNR